MASSRDGISRADRRHASINRGRSNVSWMRFSRPARSSTSMPAANQSSPSGSHRRSVGQICALSVLPERGFCQASDSRERSVDEATLEHSLARSPWRSCCIVVRRAARRASASEPKAANTDGPSGSNESRPRRLGFTLHSRPGSSRPRRSAGGADAGERAEMAPHPDRRAARRRHARRLQDGRFRPRQAARMGLEGGARGAGGAAQLSRDRPSADACDRAADRQEISRSTRRRSRPTRIPPAAPPSERSMATASRARHRGQVVYVNYGRPEDFAALEKMGIDVKGKIVLVRYGELFRGLKVRNAQKRGASRHPDLLRPGRRWIRQGGRLSARAISARLGHSARQRPVPLAGAGRSVDAVWSVGQGSEAASDRSTDNGFHARRHGASIAGDGRRRPD